MAEAEADVNVDDQLVECTNETACAGGPPSDVAPLLQTDSTIDASDTTATPLFALAARGFSSKYRGVSWQKNRSKWQAHGRNSLGAIVLIGYFSSQDDAARAHDKHIQDHTLNLPLNENADGVLVARARGSVYKGVAGKESASGKINFIAHVRDDVNGGGKQIYVGRFDEETHAAIAHDAYVRLMPPAARSRLVNFLSFDEQTKLKLPRPFLIQIVRKPNSSGLQWEKATINECKTDNSAHAQEHSACLLYFLEFEDDSAPSGWDSLLPSDPMSCVFKHRQVEVVEAPKKTATRRAREPKTSAPAGRPPASGHPPAAESSSREQGWWKKFKM